MFTLSKRYHVKNTHQWLWSKSQNLIFCVLVTGNDKIENKLRSHRRLWVFVTIWQLSMSPRQSSLVTVVWQYLRVLKLSVSVLQGWLTWPCWMLILRKPPDTSTWAERWATRSQWRAACVCPGTTTGGPGHTTAAGHSEQTQPLLSAAGKPWIKHTNTHAHARCNYKLRIQTTGSLFSCSSQLSPVEAADCGAAPDPQQPRRNRSGPVPEVTSSSWDWNIFNQGKTTQRR